jgi:GTPase SAR1 family protein
MSYNDQYIPRPNRYAQPQTDINILILGETGVGKSTFINAFTNYILYNTLNDAIKGDMQVLIPAAFHMTDPDSHELDSRKIFIGNPSEDEKCEVVGQSSTQICHSYIFPIGNRLLRLIDAPGVGDVRGVPQDAKNCEHILAYINHYEHLNGICIVLKANHERLTVGFRFCFKEILTHLNINAKDNLMFIFTSGRTTFYRPGSTTPLVRSLLKELYDTWKVEVPFNKGNTFIFDNEAFRFLALHKNGMRFSADEVNTYSKSWEISVTEVSRLIERILECSLHAIRDSLSINDAQQLIRLLTRPIGEIARLIQENIQLAEKYKQNVLKNPLSTSSKRMPQKNGKVVAFDYPRTVCTNTKCTQIIVVDDQPKVNYTTKCHPHCELRDVERECVGHSILQYCTAINQHTGYCFILAIRYKNMKYLR